MNLVLIIISIKFLIRFTLQEEISTEKLLDEALSDIIKITSPLDVISIVRDELGDKRTRDILRIISKAITTRIPTVQVDSNFRDDIYTIKYRDHSLGMSSDLLLYVYISKTGPDRLSIKKISSDLIFFIKDKVRPKILIIMILEKEHDNFIPLFDLLWKNKILDVAILECSILKKFRIILRNVYRYDPFKGTSTKQEFSLSVQWYLDEFPSMQGYPFVYSIFERPPYSIPNNKSRNLEDVYGVDSRTFQFFAKTMNFTAVPSGQKDVGLISRRGNKTADTIFSYLINNRADVIANRIPMIFPESFPHIRFSKTVQVERWCFVVPKIRRRRQLFNGNPIVIVLVTVSIVVIFWLCSILFKFDRRRWNGLTIVGVLLAVSMTSFPKRFVERIILICAFTASALYSSTLFAQLTTININKIYIEEFDRLTDLLDSGLVVMTFSQVLKVILEDNEVLERFVNKSSDKVVAVESMFTCIDDLLKFKNVTCYMDDSWANFVANTHLKQGYKRMVITNICPISPIAGYVFPKSSPYVGRVNEILMSLLESGIYDKWYYDQILHEEKENVQGGSSYNAGKVHIAAYYQILCFIALCYLFSFIVFLGELLWKFLKKRMELKRHATLINSFKNKKKH